MPPSGWNTLEYTPSAPVCELQQDQREWYAIRVRSKFETAVSTTLRGKGFQEFLPLHRARRVWSDRTVELDLPLFPGYLFCRFDVTGRLLPILTTPGVVSILGAGRVPIPIAAEEIAAIQTIIASGLAAQPYPYLNVGSRVFLERGPLKGIDGVITKADEKYQLVVSVSLLQRSMSVEIDRDWVRPF